ncbi:MAG: trimethylamine methyltransferase family protein [Spirochaetaceae bacterium]|nr:MAG: trimethylamine methyltransferase family protein [Spirochaetaceae bacterium]
MRANTVHQKTAGLNLISTDQCEEIYLAALEVLDRVGVNVFEPEALELLAAAGARVQGERVRIPDWMVRRALSTAPGRIAIGRRGSGRRGNGRRGNGDPAAPIERAMLLDRGRIYFGSGSDTQFTCDIQTGERRLATKEDVATAARLCDALPNIDFVMSLGLAADVPTENSYVHQFEAMVLNTAKPIIYTAADLRDVRDIVSMAEAVAGGAEALRANPSLILYAEPSSPLQHSSTALQKLMFCAEQNLPVLYVSAAMLGGTAPVTMAGGLVICCAESLSGLVVHQLKAPGAPFIYGGSAPAMDARTALCSYGSPELQMACSASAELAHYFNLPVFTTAGCSDSQVFDQQAGMEAGYTILMQALAGSNLIHDLGYIGAGMTSSMEMLVLCDEMAAAVRYLIRGLEVSPLTLAVDLIERVGPGGNFFAEEHTAEHFRESLYLSDLPNRLEFARWQQEGERDFYSRTNDKVRRLLSEHQPPELPARVVEAVKAVSRDRDEG